ncbi:TonB-dependent receptor domain-containing protein [Rhodanobacter lindaniclasticus]
MRFYASYGKGFETPSFNELGYRSDGQPGLAFDLRPARSRNLELGAKWQLMRALAFDAAAFRADTRDELAVRTSESGRSTYQNVGRTRRQGVEWSLTGELADDWQISVGVTHLQARFRSASACRARPCTGATPVAAGSRMPGAPETYGSLRVRHGGQLGWHESLDLTRRGCGQRQRHRHRARGRLRRDRRGCRLHLRPGRRYATATQRPRGQPRRPPLRRLGDRQRQQRALFRPPGRRFMLGARLVLRRLGPPGAPHAAALRLPRASRPRPSLAALAYVGRRDAGRRTTRRAAAP